MQRAQENLQDAVNITVQCVRWVQTMVARHVQRGPERGRASDACENNAALEEAVKWL